MPYKPVEVLIKPFKELETEALRNNVTEKQRGKETTSQRDTHRLRDKETERC